MSQSRSALVSGVNGFVGAAVARCLTVRGWHVHGLMRLGHSRDRLAANSRLQLIEVENYSLEALQPALQGRRVDVVINLAAAGVMTKVTDPVQLFLGNGLTAANLVQAAAGSQVRRFLHIGSYSEYAPGQPGIRMRESWPTAPTGGYGVAKLTATHLARIEAQRLGIPLTTLRLFGVYGTGEAPHRLLPALARRLQNGETVDLTPGLQQRDWLYVDDAAEAIEQAAGANDLGPSGAVYNICTGESVSVREVGDWAAELVGAPPGLARWGALPYRPDEPMWAVGDGARFRERTGWQPRWSWRDGVRATVQQLTPANRAA